MMEGLNAFQQQAIGVLSSSKLAAALDISHESAETLARYGKSTAKHVKGTELLDSLSSF